MVISLDFFNALTSCDVTAEVETIVENNKVIINENLKDLPRPPKTHIIGLVDQDGNIHMRDYDYCKNILAEEMKVLIGENPKKIEVSDYNLWIFYQSFLVHESIHVEQRKRGCTDFHTFSDKSTSEEYLGNDLEMEAFTAQKDFLKKYIKVGS